MYAGRLHAKGRWLIVLTTLALCLVFAPSAFAAGVETKVGDVQTTIYAPSLIWGGTNAHIIVKLTNTGSQPVTVDGLYKFPEGKEGNFSYNQKTKDPVPKEGVTQSVKDVKPGESKYMAFTYVSPKVTAPVGSYSSNLTLKVGNDSKVIPWNFDVREGTRYQVDTGGITILIYGVSVGMLVFWFVYFKGFVARSFNIWTGQAK